MMRFLLAVIVNAQALRNGARRSAASAKMGRRPHITTCVYFTPAAGYVCSLARVV